MIKKVSKIIIISWLCSGTAAARDFDYYRVILDRNIFKPLWKIQANNQSTVNEEELLRARQEEEKRQTELKKQEEAKQLDNKKKELEKAFVLSGVVFDGKKTYAMITDQRTGVGGRYFLGDKLDNAVITSIDENTQTVIFDYQNRFQITLKIGMRY